MGPVLVEETAVKRKRLLYQSRHRGTREADLLLGGFAESRLGEFGDEELEQFEVLMGETDANVMDWVMGRSKAPERVAGGVFSLLVDYKRSLTDH